jgi:hypothetical protein
MDIEFINMSLDFYDKQLYNHKEYFRMTNYVDKNGFIEFYKDDKLEKKEEYEILGIFDNNQRVFIWSWLIPSIENKFTNIARDLLNYALKLEPSSNTYEHYFLKTTLLNSRIFIENQEQMDILLSVSCYLIKNKSKFIYSGQYNLSKTNFITIYYIIKNI